MRIDPWCGVRFLVASGLAALAGCVGAIGPSERGDAAGADRASVDAPRVDASTDRTPGVDAAPDAPPTTVPDGAAPDDVPAIVPVTPPPIAPSRVLVVYNANWTDDGDHDGVQDSLEVANYYAARRGVPSANVLGIPAAGGTDVSAYGDYAALRAAVLDPIRARLGALGPRAIDVILLCYGVPFAAQSAAHQPVSIDNIVMALDLWDPASNTINPRPNPYAEPTPGVEPDLGHFDHASYQLAGTDVYLVTRLDGPRGVRGALELVDQALYGDRYVFAAAGYYQGTGYVDSRYGQNGGAERYTDAYLAASSAVTSGAYYSYQTADENIASAERAVTAAGFPLRWENTASGATIGDPAAQWSDGTPATAAPRALWYGGWYNYNHYNDVFEWLPGSVVVDLFSESLYYWQIRAGSANFTISALARGASCVSGTVGEPFVSGHPRPNAVLHYMLRGFTFAEAAALGTPQVGFMSMHIGDPLYAPTRPRPPLRDARAPVISAGYPTVAPGGSATEAVVSLVVDDAPEPEVVRATVEYGATTAYGATADSGQGYWRRHAVTLTGLVSGESYHYRVRVRDPSGNETVSGDLVFRQP